MYAFFSSTLGFIHNFFLQNYVCEGEIEIIEKFFLNEIYLLEETCQ